MSERGLTGSRELARIPFDQFHKALLTGLLDSLGQVDVELEVPSQLQYIDAAFEPDARAAHSAALGWLAAGSTALPDLCPAWWTTAPVAPTRKQLRTALFKNKPLSRFRCPVLGG